MSFRLEMLQVARLAPKLLGDSAELVRDFILRQQGADGGFTDRAGQSDLYYSVFGLDALLALQVIPPLDRVRGYLTSFGEGKDLDFVHACALARAWAALANAGASGLEDGQRGALLSRVETFRTADGGYNVLPGSRSGTAYGGFLALGAYQDLQRDLPEPWRMVQSLKFLETTDGAWANERGVKIGSTTATAAAVTLLRHLGAPVSSSVAGWLKARAHRQGGFLATPSAPLPDLLSTATALHALIGMQERLEPAVREACLDFIDTLWTNEGGFHGHWGDDYLDVEYTFYGLLALGHLSL